MFFYWILNISNTRYMYFFYLKYKKKCFILIGKQKKGKNIYIMLGAEMRGLQSPLQPSNLRFCNNGQREVKQAKESFVTSISVKLQVMRWLNLEKWANDARECP